MFPDFERGHRRRLRDTRISELRPGEWIKLALIAAVLAAAIILLALATGGDRNPGNPRTDDPAGTYRVTTVTVDNRPVRCITWTYGDRGGISCDWTAARPG